MCLVFRTWRLGFTAASSLRRQSRGPSNRFLTAALRLPMLEVISTARETQIAYTLPPQEEPHYNFGLHPFFDNLVAEGWLARAQARALGIRGDDRFARLLAFGLDCPGVVSVLDPKPATTPDLTHGSGEEIAALTNRASISGVQPKLFAVQEGKKFRPAQRGEPSTHIAKLPSPELEHLVELEYMTTNAAKVLLPHGSNCRSRSRPG